MSSTPNIIQPFIFPEVENMNLFIKREDLIHPLISGNKFWKLKYNIEEAKRLNSQCLVTFGGAMSNHIHATSALGHEQGIKTYGIIRGEEIEHKWRENNTLLEANKMGMDFLFVTREDYRLKEKSQALIDFLSTLDTPYLIPEGGTNHLAVMGTAEILTPETASFDIITTAVGTGGTLAGLSNSAFPHQNIIGFPALKGGVFLHNEIIKYSQKENFVLNLQYHFRGYGKVNEELIEFINTFYTLNKIPLDPIYTGKMMYGLWQMIKKREITKDKKILAIHTGGLQGISEANKKLNTKIITHEI